MMRKTLSCVLSVGELFVVKSDSIISVNDDEHHVLKNSHMFIVVERSIDYSNGMYYIATLLCSRGRYEIWWSFDSHMELNPNTYVEKAI
jgi:hypothetical protein